MVKIFASSTEDNLKWTKMIRCSISDNFKFITKIYEMDFKENWFEKIAY